MNINSINDLIGANNAATAANNARTNVGADQTTFLKLLIAQMKHQDPLAPQDSTQYIAQLAQFSSLEQLTSINTKLGQLLDLGNQ